jgi:hypothetical protein
MNTPQSGSSNAQQIVMAVLFAGIVPLGLVSMLVVVLHRDVSILGVLLQLIVPFACGLWTAFASPESSFMRNVILSLSAGFVYFLLNRFLVLFVFSTPGPPKLADNILIISTVALFFSGGYFGDLTKGSQSGGTALNVILTLGPSVIGLITTIIGIYGR